MFKEPNYGDKDKLWDAHDPFNESAYHATSGGNWLKLASSVMILGSGIILSAIRMLEPYFQVLVCKKVYQFYGDEYELESVGFGTEKDRQMATDTLNTFLTSSLNVELVFVILKCIGE